jgi:hypothetical protein
MSVSGKVGFTCSIYHSYFINLSVGYCGLFQNVITCMYYYLVTHVPFNIKFTQSVKLSIYVIICYIKLNQSVNLKLCTIVALPIIWFPLYMHTIPRTRYNKL